MHKILILALLVAGPGGSEVDLVVHEWGTFTSISGDTGQPVPWRPLSGPSDLPGFVYKGPNRENGLTKWGLTTVRMETPVLYFYTGRERDVAVKVGFPNGRITEWYPKAAATRTGIDWGTIRLRPGTSPKLLHEGKPSHYYPAREVDAAPVQVGAEHEKLLFYRGVGHFPLPIEARLHTDDEVVLRTDGSGPVKGVILFENRGGRTGWRTVGRLEDKAKVLRPELGRSLPELRAELERLLTAEGLYAKEAAAMLETWKDSWFEEGLRVFYLVPRRDTDAILPLTVTPKPRSCVRVLVGRAELITNGFRERIEGLVEKLDAPRPAEREAALAEIKGLGRFAHPVLERIAWTVKTKESKDRLVAMMYR